MRELTADMFVSLDGFAAGADGGQSWTFGYFGPEFAAYAQRILPGAVYPTWQAEGEIR